MPDTVQRINIPFKNSQISCLVFGEGTDILVAFHGFGDRAALFLKLEPSLGKKFKIYAIDLPYHGHTVWNEPKFNEKVFLSTVNAIRKIENVELITLMGYSFGCKIAQRVFLRQSRRTKQLILLAPDGFYNRFILEITMIPRPIRYAMRWILNQPSWFVKILEFFYKLGVINRFIFQFTHRHLGNIQRRARLFAYWISMDDFNISRSFFIKKVNAREARIDFFIGTSDDIVSVAKVKELASHLQNTYVHELATDHKIIGDVLNDRLGKSFKNFSD